jgi:soluble lytic murein transglycosylase-like protein
MLNLIFKKEKPFSALIKKYAAEHKLDPKIVAAVILQESSGNTYAFRYEPAFFERYLNNKLPNALGGVFHRGIELKSEIRFRAFSFGLMQIMGQTAVENGFKGFLPQLFEPEINIELGCKVLARALKVFDGDYRKALSAYNSGVGFVQRNGATIYADKVIARVTNNEVDKIL